jgi:hypothetical protein
MTKPGRKPRDAFVVSLSDFRPSAKILPMTLKPSVNLCFRIMPGYSKAL